MRRVYGYLIRRRGIDKDVLDALAYLGLVYESIDYHNAVFVGIEREGKPRHIHKHSTAAQGGFKGNAPPGSEPEFSLVKTEQRYRENGGNSSLVYHITDMDGSGTTA